MSKEVKVVDTDSKIINGENRCPACGASDVTYNIKKKKLVCNYCYFEFEAESLKDLKDAKEIEGEIRTTGTKDIKENTNNIITLRCGGCGAEVVINTSEAVNARCHWCRSVLSINYQIENGAVPDVVLPFNLEKKEAQEKIQHFVDKRKFFANNTFRKEFTTNNIMGVYFPYMLVDANCHGVFKGEGEHLVRKYKVSKGKQEVEKYDADSYSIVRDFDIAINDLSIESSQDKLDKNNKSKTTNVINSIMPFDTENCVKYKANYLVGYTSEKRDINVSNIENKVDKELKDITRHSLLKETQFYDRGVKWEEEKFDIKGKQWVSAYLPVWLYSYQDKRKVLHYVAVNARTGETMGSVPMNKIKLLSISVLLFILFQLIVFAFANKIYINALWIIIGLLISIIFYCAINSKYRNKGARHSYEKETKTEISNMKKGDVFIKHKLELDNPYMYGANDHKIEGENVKLDN